MYMYVHTYTYTTATTTASTPTLQLMGKCSVVNSKLVQQLQINQSTN